MPDEDDTPTAQTPVSRGADTELASLAVNAANALRYEKRHYEIACEENARLRAAVERVRGLADAIDAEMRIEPDTQRAAMQMEAAVRIRAALDRHEPGADPTLLAELQQHLAKHTPSCNARTDHLMRRAAWALGSPRPEHVGGNAEDCPGCEGTNPPYPFICPGPAAAEAQAATEGQS